MSASRKRSRRSGHPSGRPAQRRIVTAPLPDVRIPQTPQQESRPAVRPISEQGALPPDGAEYPLILRGETHVWWRSLLGALFGLSLFLLLTAVVSQALVSLFWATTANDQVYRDYYTDAFAFRSPLGMLAVNLGIATLIPISWGLVMVVHQVRPRWLFSVAPGIRWRYLLGCLAIAAVTLIGVSLLSTMVQEPLRFGVQQGFWGFFAVIVLTSPVQAVAEEIFFRGYLMQALGSLVRTPWFGVIVSSVVFALLHGTQNLPLFVDRLAFGLLAAILVWRTGGLEAGIAAHVINNVCAYLIAGLTSSIATLKAIREIGWLDAVFDVGAFALFALLAYLFWTRLRLRRRVDLSALR